MTTNGHSTARPGFLFLVCPDAQLLRERFGQAEKDNPPQDGGAWDRSCYWGDTDPPQDFWSNLSETSLFGASHFIVVRQANLWSPSLWRRLDKILSRPLGSSLPVFCLENAWDRGRPKLPVFFSKLSCFDFAGKKGWIWRSEGLTDRNIGKFIQKEAAARGLSIPPQVLQHFAETVPRSAEVVCNELDKVMLMHPENGEVSPSMLATADWAPDASLFECLDCLYRGDARGTWRELSRVTDMDTASFQLLGLLAMNLRKFWQSMSHDKVSFYGTAAGMMPRIASSLGPRGLAAALSAVADAEKAIKTGQAEPGPAIEFLLSRLLPLFRRA